MAVGVDRVAVAGTTATARRNRAVGLLPCWKAPREVTGTMMLPGQDGDTVGPRDALADAEGEDERGGLGDEDSGRHRRASASLSPSSPLPSLSLRRLLETPRPPRTAFLLCLLLLYQLPLALVPPPWPVTGGLVLLLPP